MAVVRADGLGKKVCRAVSGFGERDVLSRYLLNHRNVACVGVVIIPAGDGAEPGRLTVGIEFVLYVVAPPFPCVVRAEIRPGAENFIRPAVGVGRAVGHAVASRVENIIIRVVIIFVIARRSRQARCERRAFCRLRERKHKKQTC